MSASLTAGSGGSYNDGQPIRCRFTWSDITETTAKWRQEFSTDDGQTWKANWYMDSTRLPDVVS